MFAFAANAAIASSDAEQKTQKQEQPAKRNAGLFFFRGRLSLCKGRAHGAAVTDNLLKKLGGERGLRIAVESDACRPAIKGVFAKFGNRAGIRPAIGNDFLAGPIIRLSKKAAAIDPAAQTDYSIAK